MSGCTPAQLKLTLGKPVGSSVWVSWTTTDSDCDSTVDFHEVVAEPTASDPSYELMGGSALLTPTLSASGSQLTYVSTAATVETKPSHPTVTCTACRSRSNDKLRSKTLKFDLALLTSHNALFSWLVGRHAVTPSRCFAMPFKLSEQLRAPDIEG